MIDLTTIRKDYKATSLSRSDVNRNPFVQFEKWMNEALAAHLPEPTAMTLATVDSNHKPSARIVLLKAFNENGFIFFTNFESRKGMEIENQPYISALFFWQELERQIRIEGVATKISEEESLAYFQSRPRESQLGAWASPQSQIIANRPVLDTKLAQYEHQFALQNEIPKPPNWGGYCIKPEYFEFWQGRPSRLHDRISYQHDAGGWRIERLAP